MLLPLRNPVRTYAWGSRRALAALRGDAAPSAEPEAELWIGAHPRAPSEVFAGGTWRPLDEWLAARGGALPFLLKVLAAERPLSLQAHPDRAQAARGFAREEAAGVPRDAPARHYPDPHAKPELVVALEPFRALCGLRPLEAVRELATPLAIPELDAALAEPVRTPGDALLALLALGGDARAALAAAAREAAEPRAASHGAYAQVVELATLYPADAAIVAPLFLESLTLAPGEAIFLPAGRLHAYLGGVALELQAPSDNVLRAGLTAKAVDVEALGEVVERAAARPGAWPGEHAGAERSWRVEDAGLRLAWLELDGEPCTLGARGTELLLALDAEVELRTQPGHAPLRLARGRGALWLDPKRALEVRGRGRLVRAGTLP